MYKPVIVCMDVAENNEDKYVTQKRSLPANLLFIPERVGRKIGVTNKRGLPGRAWAINTNKRHLSWPG